MEKICLDFEAALDFLRGEQKTIEKLKYYADREEICITSPDMFHLFKSINKPAVATAFANSVTVLPFDRRAAQIAASISRELVDHEGKGDGIVTAAICIASNAYLFSKNSSKFDRIKGLKKV